MRPVGPSGRCSDAFDRVFASANPLISVARRREGRVCVPRALLGRAQTHLNGYLRQRTQVEEVGAREVGAGWGKIEAASCNSFGGRKCHRRPWRVCEGLKRYEVRTVWRGHLRWRALEWGSLSETNCRTDLVGNWCRKRPSKLAFRWPSAIRSRGAGRLPSPGPESSGEGKWRSRRCARCGARTRGHRQ